MKKIGIKLDMTVLIGELSQLTYHLQEAQKLIDSINSMKTKDLVDHQDSK